MSGIVAVFSKNSKRFIKPTKMMLNKIRHRGMGKRSIYTLEKAILGKNFLSEESIPKFNDGEPAVIADGDIISDESDSTEEALIKEFKDKGESFVNNIEGSFAFVLSDGENLMAARDPLGLKPLYYAKDTESMVFASEIKALTESEVDIREFPPGHYYLSEKGFVKYYDTSKINVDNTITSSSAVSTVKESVINAVEKRYEANKDTGVFLSGGIDSSVIASVCKEVYEEIDTFSVGVEGSGDLQKARKVARHIGSRHHEYVYELDEMLKILPKVIYHLESFDMFLVRSAVANYMLSRMASANGENTIYCGEGADEIFAGYQYLKGMTTYDVDDELKRLTFSSYKNGFQRVDRMITAFSMQSQLPFADSNVTEYALKLPVKYKLYYDNGTLVEKWVLRKAFENYLPEDIIWRKKQKFSEGAGSVYFLKDYAEETITDEQFIRQRKIDENFILRSKEELMYYNIFREYFPDKSILDTIGRTRTD